jgi:AAA domain
VNGEAQHVTRDSVRDSLRTYMARTGYTAREIGDRAGYARQTVMQFMSSARFGDRDGLGQHTAERLAEFMRQNPAPLPELPGRLYETAATREIDRALDYICGAHWGTLYGPSGGQKSFTISMRAAEAARSSGELRMIAIRASASAMSPRTLLARIGQALGAPYAYATEPLRQAVVYAIGKRKTPLAIVLDEAQHLMKELDTLETLREIGDLCGRRVGILVAGNEGVLKLFSPRKGIYFEQWRSRVQQIEVKVLGPSRDEARRMLAGELGERQQAKFDGIIEGCTVTDPITQKKYVNAHRLFQFIRSVQEGADRKRAG